MEQLEQIIGYTFQNKKLLRQALTHSSYANEKKLGKLGCNERLEFLGDAVLELISSDFLYKKFPQIPEGELTKKRASLVCEPSLAYCARQFGLPEYLLLGRGEDMTGGRMRDSIVSDATEALLGAIYAAATGGKIAEYALICAVGALISMVGDLAASAIKRNHNIKDYGTLIPGHGGIMDRFDSVIFTAPVIYYLSMFMMR